MRGFKWGAIDQICVLKKVLKSLCDYGVCLGIPRCSLLLIPNLIPFSSKRAGDVVHW
jgi:hypothetical protein